MFHAPHRLPPFLTHTSTTDAELGPPCCGCLSIQQHQAWVVAAYCATMRNVYVSVIGSFRASRGTRLSKFGHNDHIRRHDLSSFSHVISIGATRGRRRLCGLYALLTTARHDLGETLACLHVLEGIVHTGIRHSSSSTRRARYAWAFTACHTRCSWLDHPGPHLATVPNGSQVTIFLLSSSLILNLLADDHRRSIADVFRIQVVSNSDVRSPIITLGSTSFFHVRINNLYVVAVTK